MAYRQQQLGFFVKFQPKEASRIIIEAVSKAGSLEKAASDLDVGVTSLYRWIGILGLEKKVATARKKSPNAPKIGRPEGSINTPKKGQSAA
jgi:hypothetical protein